MKLIIDTHEYIIVDFNFTINFGNTDEKQNVSVVLDQIDDIIAFSTELESSFKGKFSVQTNSKTYSFSDFTIEQISVNADTKLPDRISLRFSQNNNRE